MTSARLAADLGHQPAGQRRHPAGERHPARRQQQPARARSRRRSSNQAPSHDSAQHQHAHADHHAEGEEHRRHRRMLAGETRSSLSLRRPARASGSGWRPSGIAIAIVVALRARVGQREQHQRRAALGVPERLHGGDLRRADARAYSARAGRRQTICSGDEHARRAARRCAACARRARTSRLRSSCHADSPAIEERTPSTRRRAACA